MAKSKKNKSGNEKDPKSQRQTSLLSFFGKPSTLPPSKKNGLSAKAVNSSTHLISKRRKTQSIKEQGKIALLPPDVDDHQINDVKDSKSITSKRKKVFNDNQYPGNEAIQESKDIDDVDKQTKAISSESKYEINEESSHDDSSDEKTEEPTDKQIKKDRRLSDYELLRLRNIERNNARMVKLGLLTGEFYRNAKNETQTKRRPRRKPSLASSTNTPKLPTRRSTRARRSVLEESSASLETVRICANIIQSRAGEDAPKEDELETETFIISPLLQYAIDDPIGQCIRKESPPENPRRKSITSLSPAGPRLIPPKGLKAIYALDFFSSSSNPNTRPWLVGAGKAGIIALWDCQQCWSSPDNNTLSNGDGLDPVLTWKAHSGRWIAEARFLQTSKCAADTPCRLVTAANDGIVCLWDLTEVSVSTGAPKLVARTGKELHTSGIFAMDILDSSDDQTSLIATGSKDKTVALTRLAKDSTFSTFWRSDFHSAKVSAVNLRGKNTSLLASASDDGYICIHDYKMNENTGIILANAHSRPHSVVWDPFHEHVLMTAGLDKEIKIWDIRSTKHPLRIFQGHVPGNTVQCKRIHHPSFYYFSEAMFVLTGGEQSRSFSMYRHDISSAGENTIREDSASSFYSRGTLPVDCGDVGCVAVHESKVAVSVDNGEILILGP